MRRTTPITMEHIVVASYQPFEKVSDALEARLGAAENWGAIGEGLLAESASEEQVAQTIEEHLGTSGLILFSSIEHSHLLSLLGKTTRATQFTIGNPLLALPMTASSCNWPSTSVMRSPGWRASSSKSWRRWWQK